MIQQPSSKAQATQFNFLSTSLTPKIKKSAHYAYVVSGFSIRNRTAIC